MEDKGLLEDMRFHMESLTIWSQSSGPQIFSALSSSHSHLFMYPSILPLQRSKSPASPKECWNKQPATGITDRYIKTAIKTARVQRTRQTAAVSQIPQDSIVMKTDKTICDLNRRQNLIYFLANVQVIIQDSSFSPSHNAVASFL